MKKSLVERFHKKYVKTKTCWNWIAYKDKDGYGTFSWDGYPIQAHRAAYKIFNNYNDPGKYLVCHTCDNPSCVNPDHLFLGTHTDNMQDMRKKGRENYAKGENVFGTKLKLKDIKHIKNSTLSSAALAKYYGVTLSNISAIRRGKSWKYVK